MQTSNSDLNLLHARRLFAVLFWGGLGSGHPPLYFIHSDSIVIVQQLRPRPPH